MVDRRSKIRFVLLSHVKSAAKSMPANSFTSKFEFVTALVIAISIDSGFPGEYQNGSNCPQKISRYILQSATMTILPVAIDSIAFNGNPR